jgi:hypothetical protein
MAETEHITVAEISEGSGGVGSPGTDVSLPVVELLTGRGFITGKSGSGKSNSASVLAENLLDNGFGLLIVDIDGEYYGLKEEYEILHVGADEECDIQITTDHAEKMATLALEQNVPIILDISSFLDEEEAEAVLTAVARHLFAKAKKHKQPFLMLVEEVHEYIPENGSVGEAGKMLIKIGKRGRKHGLGIVGISQRPADVKKDYITQCDWLVWHRLTWDNDTKVVRRVLDGEYARAVEDLDDGEGFLMTDWGEDVKRVQFHRKQTFDAGATPGLEDFERPELKSVSDDLVSELEKISDEKQARDDRIEELREELDRKNSRIAELEKELQDARDMSRMADQFVDALVRHVEGPAPGRTEQERMQARRENGGDRHPTRESEPTDLPDENTTGGEDPAAEAVAAVMESEDNTVDATTVEATVSDLPAENGDGSGTENESVAENGTDPVEPDQSSDQNNTSTTDEDQQFSAEDVLSRLRSVGERPPRTADASTEPETGVDSPLDEGIIDADSDAPPEFRDGIDGTGPDASPIIDGEDENADEGSDRIEAEPFDGEEPLIVREIKADIAGMETKARNMLSFYREFGPGTPLNAHFAAGGDGDRTNAYAHNRTLRTRGLIEHVGRGRYDYALRDLLREEFDGHVDEERMDRYARNIERKAIDGNVDDLDHQE